MLYIKRLLKVLSMARISIFISATIFVVFLKVPQAQDAVIALGNYSNLFQYLFFSLLGLFWALSNWYWPRSFYYIEYHKEEGLGTLERLTIKLVPRVVGASSLLLIGITTIKESGKIQLGESGRNPLITIGIIFIVLTILFILFVTFRRKLLKLNSIGDTTSKLKEINGIIPFQNLPLITKKILLITTGISLLLMLFITILPIQITLILGDGATVLLLVFTIWIPFLYWIQYLKLRYRKPTFLLLALIILLFSKFNSNTNVRLIKNKQFKRDTISEYYTDNFNNKGPIVFILSEGGGIRAAYWSSTLLCGIEENIPNFNKKILGINGVSGGSFGITIYESLLLNSKGNCSQLQENAKKIVGKDYLSPVIAAMFTRSLIQYIIPFPIESFDHAKVFEKSWEYHWKKIMENNIFSDSVNLLWRDNSSLPPIFINMTRVENGRPFIISSHKIESTIIKDLYNYIPDGKNFRISTAALLSSRFPYVGPAGIINKNMGIVDGGYFDNTGANTTIEILMELHRNNPGFNYRNKPVIIYIKNNNETSDISTSGKSLTYQIMAPIYTIMQTRDAHTLNEVHRLKELVDFLDGDFYTFALNKNEAKNNIPLGWALSKTTQNEIDSMVKRVLNSDDFRKLKEELGD